LLVTGRPADRADHLAAARRVEGIVFDLDGVLLDSWRLMQQAFAAACRACGAEVPIDRFRRLLGRPLPQIAAALELGPSFVETYERVASERAAEVALYPDARATVDALRARGFRLAINTGKGRRRATELLTRLELFDRLDALVAGDDVTRGKPDPESLHQVARQLETSEAHLAFVGDMDSDVECARRAGVLPVSVLWGIGTAEELDRAGPSLQLGEMGHLLEVFKHQGPGP
jgi:AHBA synthesis associated protein